MKTTLKSIIAGAGLLFSAAAVHAQGLDSIIVERFYKSNAADAAGSIGTLPSGSWTYRIYVDMAPGYTFQALYGIDVLPSGVSVGDHELRLETSTTFFNNEDRCGTTANAIGQGFMDDNTVMLDSWFSVGAASSTKLGVLKSEDDGVSTVVNSNGLLQNNDPGAGIPLTVQDGFFSGATAPQPVTFVGITGPELDLFDCASQTGSLFSTYNGSVASLSSSTGPLPSNRVLVGQFTTDGVFTFKLNVQLGTPSSGTENWVADNPQAGELTHPTLMGSISPPVPNAPPTVNIISPLNGANFLTGVLVTIDANANDVGGSIDSVQFFVDGGYLGSDLTGPNPYTTTWTAVAGAHALTARAWDNGGASTLSSVINVNVSANPPPAVNITAPISGFVVTAPAVVNISANATDNGSVDSVQFFVNGVYQGSDITGPTPFTFAWTSVVGPASLTAKAWDNNGAQTTSTPVNITALDPNALGYKVSTVSLNCAENQFCLPITAVDSVDNVIGYDIVLQYDPVKVLPTGVINISNDLINPNWVFTAHSINYTLAQMNISVFFNSLAPSSAEFNGTGDIICVQFNKTINMASNDTAVFSLVALQESYPNGVLAQGGDPGSFISFSDTEHNGRLIFWSDGSPIQYDAFNPASHLITNIYGNDANCGNQSVVTVQPDLNGEFVYNTVNGPNVEILKDIAGATDVQPIVNGFDAFLTQLVLINDLNFIPTIFQIISMDVNTDGVVSAGDLSQINQRAVLFIPEFKQDWNYTVTGLPLGPASKDWLFINQGTLNSDLAYQISATYPANDNQGYSKYKVPQVPFCLPAPIFVIGNCSQIDDETYYGMALGDVNGNFATVVPNNLFKSGKGDKVVFDLKNAAFSNGFLDVPVIVQSTEDLLSIDFSLQYNTAKMAFVSVMSHEAGLRALSYYNAADQTLRFTSYSQENITSTRPVTVRFAALNGEVNTEDLFSLQGFLNGERVGAEVGEYGSVSGNELTVDVYPNPASEVISVVVSDDAVVELMDAEGRTVMMQTNAIAYERQALNVSDLADGLYILKVSNDRFVTMKKLVVN